MPLNFRPKLDKILELLLYIAHKKPGTDKYQAVKLLYLADREHFMRHGRPITFENYYALKYGPVASSAKDFIDHNNITMRRANINSLPFETKRVERKGPDKADIIQIDRPLRAVDFEVFSKSDIRIFDEILEKYGNFSFDELYNVTHKHEAWKKAWNNRPYFAKRAAMDYAEFIEDPHRRKEVLDHIGPVATRV